MPALRSWVGKLKIARIIGFLFLAGAIGVTAFLVVEFQSESSLVQEELQEKDRQLTQLSRQLEALRGQERELSQRERELEEEINSLRTAVEAKREREGTLGEEIDQLLQERARLSRALVEANQSLRKVDLEAKEIKEKLKEKEAQNIQFRRSLMINAALLQEEVIRLKEEKEGLSRELTELTKKINHTQEELTRSQEDSFFPEKKGKESQVSLSEKKLFKQHYNLGLTYDYKGNYQEALKEYRKALQIKPYDPDTHYNMGIIYDDHLKDKKKAILHYQKYLKFSPDSAYRSQVKTWIIQAEEDLLWQKRY